MLELLSTTPYTLEENQLQKLFTQYLSECLHTKRLSLHTIKSYKEVFATFQKIVPEVTDVGDLHPHMLTEFFRRLGIRKRYVGNKVKIGIRVSTTKTYFNKLMAFFRWLERNDYIPLDSISKKVVAPPAPVYDDERALSNEDIARLIASITLHSMKNLFIYKRDLAIISTFLYTGIRKNELLSLRICDLDFDNGQLFVSQVTSKSKHDRFIPMHPALKAHLLLYLKERSITKSSCPYVFISSKRDEVLTEHGLKHWVEKYKRLSKVEFHLHRFRHTFTCTLARTGVDITTIMKLLGHTTIRMTERYLRSIKAEDSREYIDRMSF